MKSSIFLLAFLSMAFALLLTVALMERSVIGLLFGRTDQVSEDDIRLTFAALKRLVDVLPYTLGVLIAASFALAVRQGFVTGWSRYSSLVLAALFAPMFYNIFLADTAAVVENLSKTASSDDILQVRTALSDAVRQHYIGLSGFAVAWAFQASYLFTMAPNPPARD